MTDIEFENALRRGLGSAIIELKNSDDKARYKSIVLRCCLNDITYDWQTEGTKGNYLYHAICLFKSKDEFEPLIIKKFLTHCKSPFFYQLSEILYNYAKEGSADSLCALNNKYDYYVNKKSLSNDEYQQLEDIVCSLFCLEGFATFKRYIAELNKRQEDGGCFDWFLIRAKNKFGKKRIESFFEKNYTDSDYIKITVDKIKANDFALDEKTKRHEVKPDMQEKITLEDLMCAVKEAATDEYPRRKFVKLKRAFIENAMSSNIAPLLEYAQSDNTLIAEIAIECLAEFKDKRIHDFAVRILNEKGLELPALRLLGKNYKKNDDELIWRLIKASTIPHGVQIDLRDVYLKNKSKDAFPALLRVYQKGECAFCRYYIVKAMENCKVLTDEMLEECLFDFYDDTRNFARRIKNRRKTSAVQTTEIE